MLAEFFHWITGLATDLAEVVTVVVVILLAGLVIAAGAFWVLARITGGLAGLESETNALDENADDIGVDWMSEEGGTDRDEPSVHHR